MDALVGILVGVGAILLVVVGIALTNRREGKTR